MSDDGPAATTLTLTRLVAAPRADVFRAWTEPELLARWWWPARFQTTYEVDLRPGGHWRFRTADLPDLGVLSVGGAYREVRPPERLVYTWTWEGADAGETLVTVEFGDRGGQTEVRITHDRFADGRARAEHAQGWADCLDRLVQATTAGDLVGDAGERPETARLDTLTITHEVVIAAPPDRVFAALTTDVDAWWMQGFRSPHSTFHLEATAGGRFYEDFGSGEGGALYATVTYIARGATLRMVGPMGMRGPVMGVVGFDLAPRDAGTLLTLSHRVTGALDGDTRDTYTTGWRELLERHLKAFVEQGRGYRFAS